MQGLVTIFGGSGFLGRYLVRSLAKQGARVRVAVRNVGRGYRLRMLGDVGQIEVVQANLRDEASVARALSGAQACVNLVAVLYPRARQTFEALHVEGARTVARLAAQAGVERLVQVSAIGASPQSPGHYGRSKAAGEAAVLEAFGPTATLIRPSVIFGPEDDFFNRFASMATISPVLPLIGGGATRFQPVYVGDVATAIASALADPASAGKTYELGGPEILTFREILELILRETGRTSGLVALPAPVAGLLAAIGDLVSGLLPPPLTSDQLAMLQLDNVVSAGALGLADLGVVPTAVEAIVPGYLYAYRRGGQYAPAPGFGT